jgi:ferredoxin-NADP reductase
MVRRAGGLVPVPTMASASTNTMFPTGRGREVPASAIVEVVETREECDGIRLLTLSRPEGYRFLAGQFMSLTLETREGRQTKSFTHSDAPDDACSRVLTRATGSAFKDALIALRPGDGVSVAGPYGALTVPEGARKVAFLVGGVGVTPAASIVRDAVLRCMGLPCVVFYGVAASACIPLAGEFDSYSAADPEVRFIYVASDPESGWTGERGHIDADLVRRHCDPLDGWHWFVSGPPAMVEAMRSVLTTLGVLEPSTSFEQFAGYR